MKLISCFCRRQWCPLVAAAACAQQARLVVDQKGDRSLAIVDPVAGQGDCRRGRERHHRARSRGFTRWAAGVCAHLRQLGRRKPGHRGNNIVVVDVAAHKIVGNIAFDHGVRPHCAVFGPKVGLLYVTTEIDHTVTVNRSQNTQDRGAIPTGQPESHMLALSHDGLRGYTGKRGPGTVSVLDVKARKTLKVIPVSGNGVQRIAIRMTTVGVYC